ncbi:MAG: pilus assembly protein PilZ [Desulfuromonadales bacterium GWD2_54_10]|nr:MAG: pilus assembly protein PilZ [Desulfuromonadales bacterium GWD2_54_10]
MIQYFDKIIRGTEHEDNLVIVQFLKNMVGQTFTFLNYYKEIPVSYDATLLNVENEMAEFQVHEYQAKAINLERRALIYSHEKSHVLEDMSGEVFYVNIAKKRVILCKFGYGKIKSNRRRFVRVMLDIPVEADLIFENDILTGNIIDLSLGGAAMSVMSKELLVPGVDINLFLKLPDTQSASVVEVGMTATIVKIVGEELPFTCYIEFHAEKHSQQQIAYYINQRQVEIIKQLKELNT